MLARQHLPSAKPVPVAVRSPQRIQSAALLGDGKTLVIVHNQREYQLRITQNGKLILTA